jgi:transcriptional regulator with XRE-family HTH domain
MNLQGMGKKIRALRMQNDLTQEALARKLDIHRTSLSQIENGERRVSVDELVRFSDFFDVSAGYLLGKEELPNVRLEKEKAIQQKKDEIRISVPRKNLKKFREVLLYILNRVGAKPNIGETVIYKLLYFIDFDYYEKYEEQLIGARYQKNMYGPTPMEFKKVVDKMIEKGELELARSEYFTFPQRKYLPLRNPDLSVLNGREIKMIDHVLERLSDLTAKQLSDYSHEDVPWLTAENKKTIDYEAVFYRTPEYSVREKTE